MLKFPPTLIYTWESKTQTDDISNVINGLSLASSSSVSWEIEILLKFAKVQKQNSILLQGKGKQNVDSKSSASYFLRMPDIGVCCVVTKDKGSSIDNVFVGTDSDIEDNYSNYIHRSLWKASGQRFLVGSCLISVGFIEHAGSAVKPCMEVSFCPGEDDPGIVEGTNTLTAEDQQNLIASQLHKVALDLLSSNTAAHTIPIMMMNKNDIATPAEVQNKADVDENKNFLVATVGSRARQWLALVTQ